MHIILFSFHFSVKLRTFAQDKYFCEIENFAYGEMYERSFSNPYSIMAADDLVMQEVRASTNDVIDLVVIFRFQHQNGLKQRQPPVGFIRSNSTPDTSQRYPSLQL